MDKESIDDPGSKPSAVDNIDSEDERVVDALEADDVQKNNPDLDINKIRDRTFNKELSDLVKKIKTNEETGNEERAGENSSEENEENDISEDKLLLMLHKLFYKTVNLADMETINTEFNPFTLYRESSTEDLDSLIKNEMLAMSLPEYAILVYDIKKKCFSCNINYINGIDKNNIIIETSEKLLSDIIDSKNAIILDNTAIERDLYLKKRFTIQGDKQKSNFLFVPFSSLFSDFFNKIDTKTISVAGNKILPVMMIRINNDEVLKYQKTEIYNTIKSKLTVYFFLLYKKILIDIQKSNTIKIQNAIDFLDYQFKKNHATRDDICCIVSLNDYTNIDFLYIIEYLYIKIKRKLINQCSVSRTDKDRIILFTNNSQKKILDQVLGEFNRIYDNIFHVKIFSGVDLNRRNIGIYLLFHQQS